MNTQIVWATVINLDTLKFADADREAWVEIDGCHFDVCFLRRALPFTVRKGELVRVRVACDESGKILHVIEFVAAGDVAKAA